MQETYVAFTPTQLKKQLSCAGRNNKHILKPRVVPQLKLPFNQLKTVSTSVRKSSSIRINTYPKTINNCALSMSDCPGQFRAVRSRCVAKPNQAQSTSISASGCRLTQLTDKCPVLLTCMWVQDTLPTELRLHANCLGQTFSFAQN